MLTDSLWRQIQRKNFTNLATLCSFLNLSKENQEKLDFSPKFPLILPFRLAQKIRKNSLTDPIGLQFLPLKQSEKKNPLFVLDPVSDTQFQLQSKLLKKYHGRALILSTSACAMNCRFCFRQNFDYETEISHFEKELEEIRNDSSIQEIILSGGDPLSLGNLAIEKLILEVNRIPHVKRLRFHTRFPIGIPERIDEGFLAALEKSRPQIYFLIHTNHPLEIDDAVISHLKQVAKLGIPILSQTVLLKGVNDSVETLEDLCNTLVNAGITPYYLHQLDRVQGSEHFEVSIEEGKNLITALRKRVSGYAVPTFVLEEPGKTSKTPL